MKNSKKPQKVQLLSSYTLTQSDLVSSLISVVTWEVADLEILDQNITNFFKARMKIKMGFST